ncbi:prolipoprotein diacylglyceryl transferase [Aquiluna sp. KACHI24]|uniref:prolipoprotein diacylglyceryl transferase n=1 Tax=Aquiluna sp. KACHI24 TaxID=2968831 RepID=UPI002200829C|nr:prolipoprotein diacylglyceryl transferase [Aquiluna sp. KACHI24]BDQ00277.1 prolipoprotein diacylglyceryl transferase 2 [Aquiluna sp. KACHI24]
MNLLLSIPSPEISFIDLGPVRIHFYALFILTGIALATYMADRTLTKRGAERGVFLDIALWAVPAGIIGGRFFHVITHPRDYLYEGADLLAVFRIWEGGLAIFGAITVGAIGAWWGARQVGLRFTAVADAVAPWVLVAQGIGRLGNYFNQELYGIPTTLPWGLEIPSTNPAYPNGLPDGLTFHPTFLYEMIWNFAGAAAILYLASKLKLQWGKVFALYLIVYSFGRIWIESIRIDPSEVILGLRTNIWSALIGVAIGIIILLVQSRRHPGLEPSVYAEGREPAQQTTEAQTTEDVEQKN